MAQKISDILIPILIHFFALQVIELFGGIDAAWKTSLAALLTMPVFWQMYKAEKTDCTKEKQRITWYGCLAVIFGAAALNLVLSAVLSFLTTGYGIESEAQDALLSSQLCFQIFGMGIFVPITEELLFRGVVYRRLKRGMSVQSAIFFGAVLFAAYHGNLLQALFAFPMGMILNLLYERYEDIRIPILFHAASNLTAVFFSCI